MRVALDAFGSDLCPEIEITAANEAVKQGIDVILVGDKKKLSGISSGVEVVQADEVITMDESPANALRKKKNSSMRVAIDLVGAGKADAVVSAGNSGAMMALSMFVLHKLPGVYRPAIVGVLPSYRGYTVFIDMGANVDCKPHYLLQFALMGSVYAKKLFNLSTPSVGLLSNGEEEGKGNELTSLTNELLKKSSINYRGYVEGKDIYMGDVDVIVADGFVGNTVLKASEGIAEMVTKILKDSFKASPLSILGYLFSRGAFNRLKKRIDYAEYGGAPLIGVNGLAVITHGRSNEKAILNAIKLSKRFYDTKLNDAIIEEVNKNLTLENSANEKVYEEVK
ncbi:MAG: phosphate acyltransferase PlsX [Deltaproteobacteria bacterium]|nr:phosphate acyltransferase PlsX [Deltaproteobacteria bacterium]